MPFLPGDRARIVDILKLVSTQDEAISVLGTLMTDVERRDGISSTNRVADIQGLLAKIEAAQHIIDDLSDDALEAGVVASYTAAGDGAVTYRSGSGPTSSVEAYRMRKVNSLRQRIRRLLDPYNYLAAYKGTGRAVDGA